MSQLANLIQTAVESIVNARLDDSYSVTETETRRFSAPSALSVETTNGGVTVRSEDRDDVEVVATKRATDERTLREARVVASGGDGDPLALRAEYDGSASDVAVEFEVAVPTDVAVERVETKNGSVELLDAAGDARVETVNGSVTAERADGYLDLRTQNGEITVRGAAGIDRAESTNGGIELEIESLRTDASVETRSGSVTILAGEEVDAEVTLSTSLGSIDAPALDQSSLSGVGKLAVTGTLGDGDHRLDATTKLGSVEFRERGSGTAGERRSRTPAE